jgi:hypothetical protein
MSTSAPREPVGGPGGRRLRSSGVADLAERQADAVAALDRVLEARLGELDRAFASRRAHLEGVVDDADEKIADRIERGLAEFSRLAGEQRRLLQEEAAAELAALERIVDQRVQELDDAAEAQEQLLRTLMERVRDLERGRVRDLD